MLPEIVVYSHERCSACRVVKQFLKDYGVAFTVKDVVADPVARAEFVAGGYPLPPVVVIGGETVVGFQPVRLLELLEASAVPDPPLPSGGRRCDGSPKGATSVGMSSVTLEQRQTPLLRHLPCSGCGGQSHFLWNPASEQYQCVRCRGVLYFDAGTGAYETRGELDQDGVRQLNLPEPSGGPHSHTTELRRLGGKPDAHGDALH